ncbi:MAG: 4-hydroxy-3-methylbut-2-enyl diphosphate reductase [Vampirovibrionales bacterium]
MNTLHPHSAPFAHVQDASQEHHETLDLPKVSSTRQGRSIQLAKHAGFCHGVKKSVQKAFETAKEAQRNDPHQPVYVLGELIHNPQMIEKLRQEHILTVHHLDEVPTGAQCVIRTHGASPSLFEEATARGIILKDATCPDVQLVQQKAIQLAQEGYTVVIVGKAQHPEVIGIMAHAQAIPGATIVAIPRVEDLEEKLAGLPRRRIGVVSQTTQMEDAFFEMVKALSMTAKELKVFNTICPATYFRQQAAQALSHEVEYMIVVGGKNSSNTTHLAEVAREKNIPALHVETASELATHESSLTEVLKEVQTIGITAGASTPDWLVRDVIHYLQETF